MSESFKAALILVVAFLYTYTFAILLGSLR